VFSIDARNLGPVNSSRSPYLHFVASDNTGLRRCVAAAPRHAYQVFEWW
jgi:hypothetical protein